MRGGWGEMEVCESLRYKASWLSLLLHLFPQYTVSQNENGKRAFTNEKLHNSLHIMAFSFHCLHTHTKLPEENITANIRLSRAPKRNKSLKEKKTRE